MVNQTVLVALATIMQPSGSVQSLKPFTSPKGGYTVSLPTKPTEKKQTLTLPGGGRPR